MRLPWRCPTAIDKSCRSGLIEMVGYVWIRGNDIFNNPAAPIAEKLGRCRRCGREHYKCLFYWYPIEGMLEPPGEAAKVYKVSRPDEVSMLSEENQRLRERLARAAATR